MWRLAFEIAVRAGKGFGKDRCGLFAAGITYYALLSLFPLLLLSLGVAGFIFSDPEDQRELVDRILEQVPVDEDSRDDLEDIIASVARASGALGLLGLLGMAYSGSALFTAIRTSLNAVYKVEKARNFVIGKLIDLGLVIFFGVLLLLSIAATFGITFAVRFSEDLVGGEAATVFSWALSILYFIVPPLITALVFWLLFTLVPVKKFHWKHTLAGAVVAALLFEVLKAVFAQYVAAFGNYDATYGALGFVIVLLLFVSFASQATLFGAEVAYHTGTVAPRWPLPPDERESTPILEKLEKARAKLPGGPPVPAARLDTSPPTEQPPPLDSPPRQRGGGSPLAVLIPLAGVVALGIAAVIRGRRAGHDA